MKVFLVLMTVVLVNLSFMGCSTAPGVDSTGDKIGPNTSILHSAATLLTQIECENMAYGGTYAKPMTSPFNGMALYGQNDYCTTSYNFSTIPGQYSISISGQSSTATPAVATVYIDGVRIGTASFPVSKTVVSLNFTLTAAPNAKTVKITGESDNGQWDLYLDYIQLYYQGIPPALPPAPTPPVSPVWSTGTYKNLFLAAGNYIGVTSAAQVDQKINTAVSNFFGYGDDSYQCYYTSGSDEAYIYTEEDSYDVRSEGMSYGMMIAVQMNMKSEFNKLWKWAKTHMQHPAGDDRAGYFSWQMYTNGTVKDHNPAPDGEEYFAMALFFASKRWGNGTGIFNYYAEATNILQHTLYQNLYTGPYSGITPMFSNNMVVFVPYGDSATFSDPSYHLPAFYELFSRWDTVHSATWSAIAAKSRAYWKTACNPGTGLFPDYANFDGTPKAASWYPGSVDFRWDAWRVIMNLSIDYYWFNCANGDTWESTEADKIQTFFTGQGVFSYQNQYSLSGSPLAGDHSPGLVAMNAVGSLVASKQQAWDFVKDLWNITPVAGKYRYYNGCLYLFGLLHVAGKFQIWGRDGGVISSAPASSSSSSSSALGQNIPGKIEAESYTAMSGIQTETCSEGTLDVGWIDANDWMDYNVTVATSGTYAVEYRVASLNGGGSVDFKVNGATLSSKTIPGTGGWQTWTSVHTTVNLSAGNQTIRLYATAGAWNINWFNMTKVPASSSSKSSVISSSSSSVTPPVTLGKIEAENYNNMYGVQTEACSEGTLNAGWIDANDWMDYNVTVATSGSYNVEYRVASLNGGGGVDFRVNGTTLSSKTIPGTGGWQTWTSVHTTVNLSAGNQTIRLYATAGGWNINWFNVTKVSTAADFSLNAWQFNNSQGVNSWNGGVGNFYGGNWIGFNNVNLSTGYNNIAVQYASAGGGSFDIRLDSPTGTLIGTVNYTSSGGWDTYTWGGCSLNASLAKGTHNVYFISTSGAANLAVFWIKNL